LREVEEILDQPDLRNDVAQARGRARELRQDFRRNLKKPDWAVVQLQVVKPLVEVRSRINDELARRQSREALVPIDRDPVPDRFSELVRRYYEELGRDK
jgi:energy-converting hydrogenase A subunit M